MASVNVKKLHGGEAAKLLGHAARWDGRKGVDYTNTDINPALTRTNSTLCFKGMDRAETSRDAYARLTARVQELDAQHPPKRVRRDRVTLVAFEIPAPEGLPSDKENAFFGLAYQEVARMCGGAKNLSPCYIHRDEVHEYVDPTTHKVRTSRVHAHVVGVPWTPERGVNGKAFCTREAFQALQTRIHDRCREELGIDFMTGTGTRSRATVEQLKIASLKAATEAARKAEERAQAAYDRMLDVLRDSTTLDAQVAVVERLKEDHPEAWDQVERDLHYEYDISASDALKSLSPQADRLKKRALDHAPDIPIDDAYPRPKKSKRGDLDLDR